MLEANDDFFAPKENLLKPSKPIFIEGKYTDRGKWMDGWETRRRRTPGYDWCIIRLGLPGVIRGVVVDTSFFTGNFPSHFSLEACDLGSRPYRGEKKLSKSGSANWIEIVPKTPLEGDSQNQFAVENPSRFTHLRLKIYPDGGVARLRVHGEVVPHSKLSERPEIDLAAVENGGTVLASSNQFYSEPLNLLMPGRGKDMSDGWETRRRRGPGHDWVILKLGLPGNIRRIEVDTAHFKGNFPESCSLEAWYVTQKEDKDASLESADWKEVLPRMLLRANTRHFFRKLQKVGVVSHVRFNIYPDGGVSRLRIFGEPVSSEEQLKGLERINQFAGRAGAQSATRLLRLNRLGRPDDFAAAFRARLKAVRECRRNLGADSTQRNGYARSGTIRRSAASAAIRSSLEPHVNGRQANNLRHKPRLLRR